MPVALVLLSGGLDSSTLLHWVRRRAARVLALTVNYGQKHVRELACARWQARRAGAWRHRVLELGVLGALGGSALTDPRRPVPALAAILPAQRDQPPTYVPHRNLVLLSVAAAAAEAAGIRNVFFGAQAQDLYGYWDCTAAFVARLNAVLRLNRRVPVRVHAPFLRWSKRRILALGLRLGVDYARTWSCYRGDLRPCNQCPACVERCAAFAALGLTDSSAPRR